MEGRKTRAPGKLVINWCYKSDSVVEFQARFLIEITLKMEFSVVGGDEETKHTLGVVILSNNNNNNNPLIGFHPPIPYSGFPLSSPTV